MIVAGMCAFTPAAAHAATVTLTPGMVPDAQTPRTANDAPVGFGPDSWMNSSTGKVNAYVTP